MNQIKKSKFPSLFIFAAFIFLISCKEDPKIVPTPAPIEIEDEWLRT